MGDSEMTDQTKPRRYQGGGPNKAMIVRGHGGEPLLVAGGGPGLIRRVNGETVEHFVSVVASPAAGVGGGGGGSGTCGPNEGVEAALAKAKAALIARREIYRTKRDQGDPFAKDDRNAWEARGLVIEALDILAVECGFETPEEQDADTTP